MSVIFLCFGLALLCIAIFVAGDVRKNTLSQVGTSVRLNCTTQYNEPVFWSVVSIGSSNTDFIYIGGNGTINGFATSGRFSVAIDRVHRKYDLVITNLTTSDAGDYICTDQMGLGNKSHAEVVVTDGLTCEELSPADGYIGDNVFGLEQDLIRFLCWMNYTGNLQPVLEWFQGDSIKDSKAVEDETNYDQRSNMFTSRVTLVARSNLDGLKLTCKARLKGDDVAHTSQVLWTSRPIYVKYAVLEQKEVANCSGLEWTLDCNPQCLFLLKYNSTGSPSCHVTYSTGNVTYTRVYNIGCSRDSSNGSKLSGPTIALVCLLLVVTSICVSYTSANLEHCESMNKNQITCKGCHLESWKHRLRTFDLTAQSTSS